MGTNAESPNSRLPYLETIHADLVQKVWALERLRKQVEQKEAALHAKVASQKQQRNMRRTRRVDTSTVKPPPLVRVFAPNITLAMGPESLVGFMTILTYWRAPPDRGPIRPRPLAARGAVVRVGLFLQLFFD